MSTPPRDEPTVPEGDASLPEDDSSLPAIPFREAVILYILCLVLMLSGGLLLQTVDLRIGLIVTEGGLILLPTLLFIRKNRCSVRQVLFLHPVRPRVLLLVFFLTFPFRICSFLISALVQTVFPMPDFILRSLKSMYAELMFPANTSDLALTILGIVVMAAVCEEAMFRGFIMTSLLKRKKVWPAIFITAIGFGIYHLDPWAIPEIVITGIFLGWLVVRTGSIYPSVIAHASFNFLGIILLPKIFRVRNVEDFFAISFPAYIYPIAFVLLAVLFFALLRATKGDRTGMKPIFQSLRGA